MWIIKIIRCHLVNFISLLSEPVIISEVRLSIKMLVICIVFNLKLSLFIHADDVLERRKYFKEVRMFSSCHIKRSLSLGVAKNSSVGAPFVPEKN